MPYSVIHRKMHTTRPDFAMSQPIETITSTSNTLVKTLKSLERKKGRQETGLFLAEGARLVEQGLERGWQAETLMIAATMADRPHLAALAARAEASGARVALAAENLMSRITHKDNAQSVIAAFRQKSTPLEALAAPGSGIWIALYEVRDPGNLGTILRTADCAGARGVILLETCCDPYSFEAVRASMGSIFDMPFAQASFAAFQAWRTENTLSLTAASVNGTVRHDKAAYGARSAIIMGNEQAGLPAEIEAQCDTLALIPMRGGADSLNLAQATAIMTYEAWRQGDFR
ncbi:RNA methyltransferase [Hyphomonas johnsonii MHS-2]|uniref:RNA methyltransferase n=2 Tax=Hyphomonas johnsonii TaxID=81031 RepID=A0A059FEE4_9PROT|nr:RNA methyltransferase [Hyphomonas johnsonii MHS-2]